MSILNDKIQEAQKLNSSQAQTLNSSQAQDEDEFFSQFRESVQAATPDDLPEPGDIEPDEPPVDNEKTDLVNNLAANVIVEGFDRLLSAIISHYAHTNERTRYAAQKSDKKQIAEILLQMMPASRGLMPPWMLLLVTLISTYGASVDLAIRDRRIYELEEEKKELERQLKAKKEDSQAQ